MMKLIPVPKGASKEERAKIGLMYFNSLPDKLRMRKDAQETIKKLNEIVDNAT